MNGVLQKSWVHVADPEKVTRVINALIEGGKDKLQVIADFDNTLTPHEYNGKRIPGCHGIFVNSPYLPAGFKEKASALYAHYYPIEVCHQMTMADKIPLMVEWWTKAHQLILSCDITKKIIEQTVAESDAMLRLNCDWMLEQLHNNDIPVLIFSAGLGDIIREIFEQKLKIYDNMKIVSNNMEFNSEGHAVGFLGEMIHVLNKTENAIHSSSYFEDISHRHNAILLGDSMGDLHMADGAELENVLKVGFLNDKVDELLPSYRECWDIVIVKDPSLDVVNSLLKEILRL